MKSSDNFFNTKTLEVSADPTSLSNDEIVFRVKSGDRFLLANTSKLNLKIKMQKYVTNAWNDAPAGDKLIVLNGAVMNMLREELRVNIIVPSGDNEDTRVINLTQDEQQLLGRWKIQRTYDKLFCEHNTEDSMHLIKEYTYDHIFANTSDAGFKPNTPTAAFA